MGCVSVSLAGVEVDGHMVFLGSWIEDRCRGAGNGEAGASGMGDEVRWVGRAAGEREASGRSL